MTETSAPHPAFELPSPGPEHQLLQPFAGSFHADVEVWMGPGEPSRSTGTMLNAWDLGGLYLRQCYDGNVSAPGWPAFSGRGYWGFNTGLQQYEGFWIDNASTMMQTETGQVDATGKIWTMTSDFIHPSSKQRIGKRSVIRLIDSHSHEMESFMTKGDGPENRTMLIRYRRIGDPS